MGRSNERNDLIDPIQSDKETFQNMGAFLSLVKFKAGAPRDHFFAEVNETREQFLEIEETGLIVFNGEHNDPKCALQLGMLIQLV